MKIIWLSILLILPSAFAQKKARNDDLRQVKLSFSITNTQTVISLKSENDSYFFLDSKEKKTRVSTEVAKTSETEFSSLFLKFKYEMGEVKLKLKLKCELKTTLVMYGEDFMFCNSDIKRSKMLSEYIAKLNKYLK
jgi:hypothetical protein